MQKRAVYLCALVLFAAFVLAACVSTDKSVQPVTQAVSSEAVAMITRNCYEVVAKKPVEDSMVYEKELDWSLVDFATRNDKYIGMGTAFAISANEFVTAAHVLSLNQDSQVFTERYIRQKVRQADGTTEEKVWEIDSVTAFSTNRDYVVFTVKDFTAGSWFTIADKVEFNKKILTAGNAYGEGIVIRDGLLLDTVPEPENGEWKLLKSSIATNPGNSGGPLLNENLEVIGIVLQKKDDFCYSLNIHDIIPGKAILFNKSYYGFAFFTKRITRIYENEVALPMHYKDLIKWCKTESVKLYEKGMKDLFAEHEKDIFPRGENSIKALYTYNTSSFPQMYLQGSNDNAWFLSNQETSASDIGKNGKIYWAEPYKDAGIFLLDIEHPDDVAAAEYTDNPKLLMDHILRGIQFGRKLTVSDSGVRILSMGDPVYSEQFKDRWGRTWYVNHWLMEFSDQLIVIFSTPTPQGVSMLYKAMNSHERSDWMWDMKQLVDYINISYMGTLEEWTKFLSRPDFLFSTMKNTKLSYTENKNMHLKTDEYDITITDDVLKVEDKTRLYMNMNIFLKKDKPVWALRRMLFAEHADDNGYALVMRMDEPDKRLPKDFQNEWKTIAMDRLHPYAGNPYKEEGHSRIGKVHKAFIQNDKTVPASGTICLLYVSKSGTRDDKIMSDAMATFENNITVKY